MPEDRRQHLADVEERDIITDLREGWLRVSGPDGTPLPYPYEVSTDGRVRRRLGRGRVSELKPYPSGGRDGTSYLKVDLRAEGEPRRQVFVHQLVAWSHIGEPRGRVVDHIDGDPRNNHLENLRYIDPQDEPKIPKQ